MSFNRDTFVDVWDELNSLEEHFDCSEMDEIGEDHGAILEMAAVGEFSSYKIAVFENEGNIPHFHVYDKQTKRHVCIKILSPGYFHHGKYQDELDRSETKLLYRWLRLPNESLFKRRKEVITNYEVICDLWEMNNPNHPLPSKIEMPNYSIIR